MSRYGGQQLVYGTVGRQQLNHTCNYLLCCLFVNAKQYQLSRWRSDNEVQNSHWHRFIILDNWVKYDFTILMNLVKKVNRRSRWYEVMLYIVYHKIWVNKSNDE